MLTNCPGCTQIVEISALNSHLIKECQERDLFKKCKTCKEAFHKDEIEAHQTLNKCLMQKATSLANRCPLCHKDIGPLEKGWKDHLLGKTCPKNDRNNLPPLVL